MTAYIVPNDGSGRVIAFDAVIDEAHETVAQVTLHPVELGSDISDHVRAQPPTLSITGLITNQPIRPNDFTKRGSVTSIELDVPNYEIPLEPTPGAAYRSGLQRLENLFKTNAKANVLTFGDPFNAVIEVYDQLLEMQENGVLLQVLTGIRTYYDLVLVRVSAPRNGAKDAIEFGLDFVRIRTVSTETVVAPPQPAVPAGVPKLNKGGQGAKKPDSGEDGGGSIAYKLLKGQGIL